MLDFGLKERGLLIVDRRTYTPKQIFNKLRQAEVLQSRWGTSKELHSRAAISIKRYNRHQVGEPESRLVALRARELCSTIIDIHHLEINT